MQDLMIITSYYPPEIGAASNRIHHLAEGLKNDYKVRVVTPLPNYPTGKIFKGHRGKFQSKTTENDIEINRLWIFATISKNKFVRLTAMLSYSFSLIWFFLWNKIPKKVIVQSPPLLVAFTCMLFLRSKKRKLILNVSDLWPSAGLDLGALNENLSYKLLKKIEHFNYWKADLILGQSNEILTHVRQISNNTELFLYRNYPDIELPPLKERKSDGPKLQIVYAGLLGVAQGVLKLCQSLDFEKIEFHIYGSGAEEQQIKNFIAKNKKLPIHFHGKIERDLLHKVLLQYHLSIIPLRHRIYGSVPSKLFEYAKLGLPMLYFGGGEGEGVVRNYSLGWIADENDYTDLNSVIKSIKIEEINLKFKTKIQESAKKHFDFEKQIEALKQVI